MNRRSFFKTICGGIAGVYAALAPSKKITPSGYPGSHSASISVEPQKRSGSKFLCKMRCNCVEQQITGIGERVMVICPNHPPYLINDDGTQEDFVPIPFPKDFCPIWDDVKIT